MKLMCLMGREIQVAQTRAGGFTGSRLFRVHSDVEYASARHGGQLRKKT